MVLLSSALSLILLGVAYALPAVAKPRSQIKTVSLKRHRFSNGTDFAPASRARARSLGSSGKSTPATNELGFYTVNITVGSQQFKLIVDSGSSNIWVGVSRPE
jgi:predicted aspartyl protease